MTNQTPKISNDAEAVIDNVIATVGKDIVFGLPLGLGKPPHIINAMYQRAKADPTIKLKIVTAISLEKPIPKSDLEARFMGPFIERLFGGVPDLDYAVDQRQNRLPANVTVSEFYFKPASFLGHKAAQQNYISSNYTYASRDLVNNGVNVVAQTIAKQDKGGKTSYSLSCNSDIYLDLVPMLAKEKAKGRPIMILGQVNGNMPFMVNDAEVDGSDLDMILDNPDLDYRLFSTPNMSIAPTDHMIGFLACNMVKDGGTLQVGIGSLGDALINAVMMRHQRNNDYRELVDDLDLVGKFPIVTKEGDLGTFEKGLYGNTEMFVHGFMDLYKAGIMKRAVYDHLQIQQLVNDGVIVDGKVTAEAFAGLIERGAFSPILFEDDVETMKRFGVFRDDVTMTDAGLEVDGKTISPDLRVADNVKEIQDNCLGDQLKEGIKIHGAFYLGPESFYQRLRELTDEEKKEISMTAVSFTNGLYGKGQEDLKNAQRQQSRYINTCMKMTLTGGAASDGLENGQVVSGIGGQFNFVAMAQENPGARSILLLKSTRATKKGGESNIVFKYGYCSIPKHLRDVVITEYGIADLRGRTDSEVMKQLIQIADSRFQDELLTQAKEAGKIEESWQIPEQYRNNTPSRVAELVAKYQGRGCFEPFPFGCDFTADELKVGKALKGLKAKSLSKRAMMRTLSKGMTSDVPAEVLPALKRMGLENPKNMKEKIMMRLLLAEMV